MQSLGMCWRDTGTRSISDRRGEARQSAGEGCPSHATAPLWATRRLAVIAGGSPSLRPACPTYEAPTRCTSWSRGRYAPVAFMDHGTRRLLGAKIDDVKQTAGLMPLAQEARVRRPASAWK